MRKVNINKVKHMNIDYFDKKKKTKLQTWAGKIPAKLRFVSIYILNFYKVSY